MEKQNLIDLIRKNIQTGINPKHSGENPVVQQTHELVKSKKAKVEETPGLSKFARLGKMFGDHEEKSLTNNEDHDTMEDQENSSADHKIQAIKQLLEKYKGE